MYNKPARERAGITYQFLLKIVGLEILGMESMGMEIFGYLVLVLDLGLSNNPN